MEYDFDLSVFDEKETPKIKNTIKKIGYPIVIKPLDGNHGKGASINVTNWEDAVDGLAYAKKYSRRVIVEKFITGFDFRVLVINNQIIAAAQRVPAHVVGDGGGVGLGGLGQHPGGAGKGGQLVALKPGDGGLNIVGGTDKCAG